MHQFTMRWSSGEGISANSTSKDDQDMQGEMGDSNGMDGSVLLNDEDGELEENEEKDKEGKYIFEH